MKLRLRKLGTQWTRAYRSATELNAKAPSMPPSIARAWNAQGRRMVAARRRLIRLRTRYSEATPSPASAGSSPSTQPATLDLDNVLAGKLYDTLWHPWGDRVLMLDELAREIDAGVQRGNAPKVRAWLDECGIAVPSRKKTDVLEAGMWVFQQTLDSRVQAAGGVTPEIVWTRMIRKVMESDGKRAA